MSSDPRTSFTDRIWVLVCLLVLTGVSYSQSLNELRLKPSEATGGTNLYSRNFGWGTSLVGLPGRSGLDAGFGISYNSLVWIKSASTSEMIYNPDSSNVGPGFKFGYSTIEYPYIDSNTGAYAFIMVGADGSRTEFRQIGSSDDFEPGDSSYRLLRVEPGTKLDGKAADIDITVYNTDGTQMHYLWKSGHYRLHEIKDRNGNHIDIEYSSSGGRLTKVIDTLGREVNIAYDSGGYPTSITQTWKDTNGSGSNVTHTWASFSYTNVTVSHNFGSLTVTGPANSTTVKVPDKITYADGSATKFEYNGYVQVKKITNIAADTTTNLNYVETDLADVSGAQSDVPRIGETRSWAKDFNLVSGTATAVKVKNTLDASQTYTLGSATGSATRLQVWVDGHPDNLRSNTFVYASGWNEGLPIGTEECITTSAACTTQKRWTWNDWTQDNESVSYILNPRIEESRVGDSGSTRKTVINYGSNGFGLPESVTVQDGSTVLKTQTTSYNLSSDYTDLRIIGLPSESRLYEGTTSGTLMSKVTFAYDENGYTDSSQNVSSPTKHASGYGTSFTYRGNRTSVKRWDVTDDDEDLLTSKTSVVYNILGSPIKQKDALNREVTVSYTDDWNDGTTRYTYAYPTTITDPIGQYSTVEYRYDMGANVEATSPPAGTQSYRKMSRRTFDSVGRLTRDAVWKYASSQWEEYTYSRYEYPTIGTHSKVFSILVDSDSDGPDVDDEVLSESFTDGAGRVMYSRVPHTFSGSSTASYAGTKTTYDMLGRVSAQSVPTEVASDFTPVGDDATRGWIYNYTFYDWKNRTVRTVPSDSNGSDGKDTLMSYDGCGCAGGQVTTIEGPSVARDDTSGNARRKQKVYEDILGRSFKTEVYAWDGTTVHTATVSTFNGRDQVTNTRQYAGNTSSGTYQDVTMSYDGHGRMATRHYPIEDANTYTTWAYNADDSVATITDPRGAVTAYTYENVATTPKRPLVTKIEYTPHSGGVDTPTVDLTYDNLGNRTSMTTAGVSEVTYAYDQLSRMTSETVDFDALSNDLTISYTYGLTGLKSIQDPFGQDIYYSNDKTGKLTAVTGDPIGNNTTGKYADNIKYRAFGQVKEMKYNLPAGDATLKMEYDNGLKVSHFEASQANSTTSFLLKSDYSYMTDGRLAGKDDLLDNTWDRSNKYDFAGRLSFNQFGYYGGTRVYEQTVAYNAFSDMTGRSTNYWSSISGSGNSFTNGRITSSPAPTYDAAGNITYQSSSFRAGQTSTFDASGRAVAVQDKWPLLGGTAWQEDETVHIFDGDGKPVISKARTRTSANQTWPSLTTMNYQIWSTVLGKSLTTLQGDGSPFETKVFAGGTHIATADVWYTADPVTGTTAFYAGDGTSAMKVDESEPLGGQSIEMTPPASYYSNYGEVLGIAKEPDTQCEMTTKNGNTFRLMSRMCQEIMSNGNLNQFYMPARTKKEESPLSILDKKDRPNSIFNLPGADNSPSNFAMARTASSTKKLKNDDDTECKPGRPCLPPENVNVPFEPEPHDLLANLDASKGGSDSMSTGNEEQNCPTVYLDIPRNEPHFPHRLWQFRPSNVEHLTPQVNTGFGTYFATNPDGSPKQDIDGSLIPPSESIYAIISYPGQQNIEYKIGRALGSSVVFGQQQTSVDGTIKLEIPFGPVEDLKDGAQAIDSFSLRISSFRGEIPFEMRFGITVVNGRPEPIIQEPVGGILPIKVPCP